MANNINRNTADSRLYRTWASMRRRCNNPNYMNYKYYGGKGIKVCERWASFDNFLEDMQEEYKPELTIDRIDPNGNYEPNNCRWATMETQARNKTNTANFEHNGKSQTLSQWAKDLGIKRSTLAQRLYVYKWSVGRALSNGKVG